MVDWTSSMQQSFEYYIVDPGTWKDAKRLDIVTSSSVSRDIDADTLGSASIDITESIDECYVRIYLVTIQNGIRERHSLGTFMIQTPTISYDGKKKSVSVDAYTPLIELKEKMPPLGYSIMKNEEIMKMAYKLTRENMRAPVVDTFSPEVLHFNFVANTSDTWLTYIRDLIDQAKHEFVLDELGRVLFAPKQDIASLQPVWTYDDNNSSILYPEVSLDRDLFDIPNVVEVIYSTDTEVLYSRVVNDDPNSPVSTISRGREKLYRDTSPSLMGEPTQEQLDLYAKDLLRDLSTVRYNLTYTHGYCPVRIGDCVRFNHSKIGLKGAKAKVIHQTIRCEPGCPVSEKAISTVNLWG